MLKIPLQQYCSYIVLIIASLGLIAYIPGMEVLGNIREGYIPMAPSTAISFFLAGLASLQIGKVKHKKSPPRLQQLIIVLLVTLFGLLNVVGFILGLDLTLEDRLVPDLGSLQNIPIARMSPATGLAFFISGTALIFYSFRYHHPAKHYLLGNIGSVFAIFVLLISSTFTLAYLYGNPLLYGLGNTIPMALTTALGFLFLAISILTIDNTTYLLKSLSQNSTRSYILSYLIPFSLFAIIFDGLVMSYSQKFDINPAFISAYESIIFITAAVIISNIIARIMGEKIDSSKAAELQALKHFHKSEEETRRSQRQLLNVIHGAQLGYWDWNYETGEHIVNDEWLSMLGLTQQDVTNHVSDWDALIHPNDKTFMKTTIQSHIESGKNYVTEFRMKHVDGRWIWIQGSGAVVEYDENTQEPLRLCGTHQDITERKKAEEATQLSARVFNDTHEGIIITDAKMNILNVNPAFSEITGYSLDDVIGQNPRILSSGKQGPELYQNMWRQVNEQGHWTGEVWNRKKGGEVYAELLTVSALKDELYKIVNYVGVFTDITSNKQQQEQLNLMAHYDVLTGLPNRALFLDRFHQAIAHSKRTAHQIAVCFLDIDDFKPVNDNYGHEVGDKLLIEVAQRISSCVREEDTISRQGGDEFALLLNDIESFAQCEKTLQRIHHALAQTFIIDEHLLQITASSGVTLYPSDDGDIDSLLRHADHAMYQAKIEGKHRYHLFNAENDQRNIQKNQQLKTIEQALVNNEFQLYYQPKVNMVTGEVFGAEALIRWLHPEDGLIPPLDFLPITEGTQLELKIGAWVINEALAQCETWNKQGLRSEVSINISSNYLLSETFYAELDASLAKHPIVASQQIQLEILESSALGDLNAISSIIKTCQSELGVKVALDDFGTGYSSLTHLRSLPVDTIKIDQSFVRDMLDDPSDYAIIDGIIGLSESFNREIIAEGVETSSHGLMLLMMGCEAAQGYGIAKPMPANVYTQWIANYAPNPQWQQVGNKYQTTKETKVKLFELVTQHWTETFINNIQSSPDSVEYWPIMNRKNCPCGTWIQRAKQDELFAVLDLESLDKAHKSFHLIAQELHAQYLDGDVETAREKLPEFQAAFDNMSHVLRVMSA